MVPGGPRLPRRRGPRGTEVRSAWESIGGPRGTGPTFLAWSPGGLLTSPVSGAVSSTSKWHGPGAYDRQRTHKPILHNIIALIRRSTRADSGRFTAGQGTSPPTSSRSSARTLRTSAGAAPRRSVHPWRMRPPENNSARLAGFSARASDLVCGRRTLSRIVAVAILPAESPSKQEGVRHAA